MNKKTLMTTTKAITGAPNVNKWIGKMLIAEWAVEGRAFRFDGLDYEAVKIGAHWHLTGEFQTAA